MLLFLFFYLIRPLACISAADELKNVNRFVLHIRVLRAAPTLAQAHLVFYLKRKISTSTECKKMEMVTKMFFYCARE